jgi:hypothetical protein
MIFVVGNSAKNYVNGDAGMTDEDKNILRSVLGRVRPMGSIPPMVDKEGASRLKLGVDCMSCMFAIHYFFQSPETLRGFIKNIGDNLKVGGYFIGACFDGEKVFDLLRGLSKGGARVGSDNDITLWKITKEYDEDEFPEGDESLGLPISVDFVTTGDIGREFLVNMKTLENALKQVGCELLSGDELKKVKLTHSTNTFDVSYDMAKKNGEKYIMADAIKQFSFLNRWFVFQRKRQASPLETESSGLGSLRQNAVQSVRSNEEIKEADEDDIKEQRSAAVKTSVLPDVPLYATGELFQFFDSAAEKDVLKIGDKTAGQWLSPSAPFPIDDPAADGVTYPSLDHYLAAQRWRVASSTPDIATSVFSNEGSIHQEFLRQRLLESEAGKKPISDKRNRELLKAESAAVRDAIRPTAFKKYKSVFDEAQWAVQKDDILMEGLRQRWETDARFRKIVEAARQKGMTLLYYTPGSNASNLGGVRKNSGTIEGENKMGKMIMELAGF